MKAQLASVEMLMVGVSRQLVPADVDQLSRSATGMSGHKLQANQRHIIEILLCNYAVASSDETGVLRFSHLCTLSVI